MFEDSLWKSSGKINTKRMWAIFSTFALQSLLVGLMILAPILHTQVLPTQQLITSLVGPQSPAAVPPLPDATPVKAVKLVPTEIVNEPRAPTKIPQKIATIEQEPTPPQMTTAGVIGGIPGAVPGGQTGSEASIIGIIGSAPVAVPKVAAPEPTRVRVFAGIQEGNLITQVKPVYPVLAKRAHIQGSVVLQAEISEKGTVEKLRVISGHPLLVPNAIAAVKQWRYKPYYVNGEPVAVETTITVNFAVPRR